MRWITAAEARLNVPRVNTNAKVLIHTIVLVDIGIMDHIVPTAVTIQQDAVTVILEAVEEAHRNAQGLVGDFRRQPDNCHHLLRSLGIRYRRSKGLRDHAPHRYHLFDVYGDFRFKSPFQLP